MRNGTVYQLPNLARTITEIGSGLLYTPTANDSKNATFPVSQKDRTSLVGSVMRGTMYPTPRASEGSEKSLPPSRVNDHGKCILSQAMHHPYWNTPNAGLAKQSYSEKSSQYYDKRIADGRQQDLASQMYLREGSGQLNPNWVEWLMGYPIGHTDLKD